MAFQISDDFLDKEQDGERRIENVSPNYMINYGREKTILKVKESIVIFRKIMMELGLWTKLFNDICLYLLKRVELVERSLCISRLFLKNLLYYIKVDNTHNIL